MTDCTDCKGLTLAALDASRAYHNLLVDLEAWYIRRDAHEPLEIREQVAAALYARDARLAELAAHRSTHEKSNVASGG